VAVPFERVTTGFPSLPPQNGRNDGMPVGYLGLAVLRRKEYDMMTASWKRHPLLGNSSINMLSMKRIRLQQLTNCWKRYFPRSPSQGYKGCN
jgi:hypothetical protein